VVYGTLLSFNGLIVMLCELPLTRLTRLHPPRAMMAAGYVLIGAGLMLNVVFQSVPALFVGMMVITLGEMTFAPVAAAHVAELAPANMRGRYMGAWSMANSLAMSVAPSLGMFLFAWRPSALWLACGAVAMLAAVTILGEPRRSGEAMLPAAASTPLAEE
jgi:predicted MFS family arabinose efflux permease